MSKIQFWINKKLIKIASQLPKLVEEDPRGFNCGHVMGYEQALLDLDVLLSDYDINGIREFLCLCCPAEDYPNIICPICGFERDDINKDNNEITDLRLIYQSLLMLLAEMSGFLVHFAATNELSDASREQIADFMGTTLCKTHAILGAKINND